MCSLPSVVKSSSQIFSPWDCFLKYISNEGTFEKLIPTTRNSRANHLLLPAAHVEVFTQSIIVVYIFNFSKPKNFPTWHSPTCAFINHFPNPQIIAKKILFGSPLKGNKLTMQKQQCLLTINKNYFHTKKKKMVLLYSTKKLKATEMDSNYLIVFRFSF